MVAKNAGRVLLAALLVHAVACIPTFSSSHQAFLRSHAGIRKGMTVRQVFEAGLADYLMRVNNNVPGSTVPKRQPVSDTCGRHLVDIIHDKTGDLFRIQVFCDSNGPSAPQVVPARSFRGKQEFLRALDTDYSSWTRSMNFRVEAAHGLFGPFRQYEFTTDPDGRVILVSPVSGW